MNQFNNKDSLSGKMPPLYSQFIPVQQAQISKDILDKKLNEVIDIFEKNIILLDEEFIRTILSNNIFNGLSTIEQIDHKIVLINFQATAVGYFIGDKLNIVKLSEDDKLLMLIIQYMKLISYEIIYGYFNIDNFCNTLKSIYQMSTYNINPQVQELQQQKSSKDDSEEMKELYKSLKKFVADELNKYDDKITGMDSVLKEMSGLIADIKKTKK